MKYLVAFFIFFCIFDAGIAQIPGNLSRFGQRGAASSNKSDTSKKKDDAMGFESRREFEKKDSIGIYYKIIDSVRITRMDSSINDFDNYYSVPSSYQFMGNNGAAAYPLVFQPNLKAGWDAGFHAFDVYKFTLEDTRFYKTNRPYTQLGYMMATGKEMMVKVMHTQNPKPNLNFGLDYRLISAPGIFNSQSANLKNYRLYNNYQGIRKRYGMSLVIVGNSIKNSENGGITADSTLRDPNRIQRFTIPVNLGNGNPFTGNPLNTKVYCGNIYKDVTVNLRQSYDIGKKDSIKVNDSTTEYLFYPKLRFQHNLNFSSNSYQFSDYVSPSASSALGEPALIDSSYFKRFYDSSVRAVADTLLFVKEKWTIVKNDFSIYQFPDTKNINQFLQVGARLENMNGKFYTSDSTFKSKNFYNIVLHGEYRNQTRNRLWDVIASGEFYLNGLNAGDYNAHAAISRHLNNKLGDIRLFFTNVNRTPSFLFNNMSSFNFGNATISKKENTISFGADARNRYFNIGFKNNLITNFAYFSDFRHTAQSSKIINLLQLYASKKIKLSGKINWYADVAIQQTDGSAPIKVPLFYTRNRIAFEGHFFKNLNLSTGVEMKYFTPYEAYNYSPVNGQFVPQDTVKLKNTPYVAAFFDFRIRSFTAYIRAENLNTAEFSNGFNFTNNNFAAPHYPTPGLMIKFGILWNFIN